MIACMSCDVLCRCHPKNWKSCCFAQSRMATQAPMIRSVEVLLLFWGVTVPSLFHCLFTNLAPANPTRTVWIHDWPDFIGLPYLQRKLCANIE